MGEGVVSITGVTEDVNVTLAPAGQAAVMALSLGQPEAKP
jgi:hypothetical protein